MSFRHSLDELLCRGYFESRYISLPTSKTAFLFDLQISKDYNFHESTIHLVQY